MSTSPARRTPELRFSVLGPVQVTLDGRPVMLGSSKARALLVALLLEANRTRTIGGLVEDLWGPEPPQTAVKMVHVFVSRVRSALGPTAAGRLETHGHDEGGF